PTRRSSDLTQRQRLDRIEVGKQNFGERLPLVLAGLLQAVESFIQRSANHGIECGSAFVVFKRLRRIQHAAQREQAIGGSGRHAELLLEPPGETRKVLEKILVHKRLRQRAGACEVERSLDVATRKALLDGGTDRLL